MPETANHRLSREEELALWREKRRKTQPHVASRTCASNRTPRSSKLQPPTPRRSENSNTVSRRRTLSSTRKSPLDQSTPPALERSRPSSIPRPTFRSANKKTSPSSSPTQAPRAPLSALSHNQAHRRTSPRKTRPKIQAKGLSKPAVRVQRTGNKVTKLTTHSPRLTTIAQRQSQKGNTTKAPEANRRTTRTLGTGKPAEKSGSVTNLSKTKNAQGPVQESETSPLGIQPPSYGTPQTDTNTRNDSRQVATTPGPSPFGMMSLLSNFSHSVFHSCRQDSPEGISGENNFYYRNDNRDDNTEGESRGSWENKEVTADPIGCPSSPITLDTRGDEWSHSSQDFTLHLADEDMEDANYWARQEGESFSSNSSSSSNSRTEQETKRSSEPLTEDVDVGSWSGQIPTGVMDIPSAQSSHNPSPSKKSFSSKESIGDELPMLEAALDEFQRMDVFDFSALQSPEKSSPLPRRRLERQSQLLLPIPSLRQELDPAPSKKSGEDRQDGTSPPSTSYVEPEITPRPTAEEEIFQLAMMSSGESSPKPRHRRRTDSMKGSGLLLPIPSLRQELEKESNSGKKPSPTKKRKQRKLKPMTEIGEEEDQVCGDHLSPGGSAKSASMSSTSSSSSKEHPVSSLLGDMDPPRLNDKTILPTVAENAYTAVSAEEVQELRREVARILVEKQRYADQLRKIKISFDDRMTPIRDLFLEVCWQKL